MSPAGVTIGLFTDVSVLGPAFFTLKVDRKRFFLDKFTLFHGGGFFPFRINNVTNNFADLLVWGILDFFWNSSSPGGVWVVVDALSDEGEILWLLRVEQVCKAILFAALGHLVAYISIIEMDLVGVKFEIGDFILLNDREHFFKSLRVCSFF